MNYPINLLADTIVDRYPVSEIKAVITDTSRYAQFQKTYRYNYAGFAFDCIKWQRGQKPTFYQEEILSEISAKYKVAVRGPHGLGKTSLAAWFVLGFALTRDGEDWKIPTTASAWRQLTKYLWPEIHKWSRMLDWNKIGREPFSLRRELQTLNLRLKTGEAFAIASNQSDLIEGAHADELAYLFDESKAIPDETFDAAEGAFSGAGEDTNVNAYALAISTPGEPFGRFYDIHSRTLGYDDWWVRHVTKEEAIKAGRISSQWAEQRKKQWGEKSALYQNRVLGEFAVDSEDSIIPLAWIEEANRNWEEWQDRIRQAETDEQKQEIKGSLKWLGIDLGSGGEHCDKTVFAPVHEPYNVDTLRKYDRGDPETAIMESVGRALGIIRKHNAVAIPDIIGIGLGFYHRMKEIWKEEKQNNNKEPDWQVISFNAAEGSDLMDESGELGFLNKRAAAWWKTRELLDPANGIIVCIPPDDDLTGELSAPKWSVTSNSKIRVENKDEIKKRLNGRSTDSADSVIQGLVGNLVCAIGSKWKNIKFTKV